MSQFIDASGAFPLQATAQEALVVADTALGPTATVITIPQSGGFRKRAKAALISVETQTVRLRFDGGTPTSSVGHLLATGDFVLVRGEDNVARILLIRATGSSGAATLTYFYDI